MAMKCRQLSDGKLFDKSWVVEEKLDGSRTIFNRGKLLTNRGINRTDRFPHVAKELFGFDGVLDGEMCIDGGTVVDVSSKKNWKKAQFVVFDVLEYKNMDLRILPLLERRKVLQHLSNYYGFSMPKQFISFNEGKRWVKENNAEGLVMKLKNSKYYDNIRSCSWIKWKWLKEAVVEIVGHESGKGHGTFILPNGRLGALSMDYVRKYEELKKKGIVFAEIQYMNKTKTGKYFQPILKRLRGEE